MYLDKKHKKNQEKLPVSHFISLGNKKQNKVSIARNKNKQFKKGMTNDPASLKLIFIFIETLLLLLYFTYLWSLFLLYSFYMITLKKNSAVANIVLWFYVFRLYGWLFLSFACNPFSSSFLKSLVFYWATVENKNAFLNLSCLNN